MFVLFMYIPNAAGSGYGGTIPGTGWGSGFDSTDTAALTVYSWDRNSAVTFSTINQTIVVDPRSYADTAAGGTAAANDYCDAAETLQTAGFKAGFRYWQESAVVSSENIYDQNYWTLLEPYSAIPVGTVTQAWWDAFNARVLARGVVPDYKIHDLEKGIGYYTFPNEDARKLFFEVITVVSESNPYPNTPNPYLDEQIWKYFNSTNNPEEAAITDAFIQEWNQKAAELRTDYILSITGDCPVAGSNYSNYEDYIETYDVGNLREFPLRDPPAQTRLTNISSMPCYLDYDTDETLTDPESSYSTARQQINRRRWKKFLWRLNRQRSAANAGDRVHPWIAPPGYGYNGKNTWAPAAQLPFEKLLWRVKMRHLIALGIDTYILWNPVPPDGSNTNSEDTDTFMDAYFTGKTVRLGTNVNVGPTAYSSNVITTNDRTTTYADVYEIGTVYWARADSPIEPFSEGFATEAEPLIINAGATGDAELAAFKAALVSVYGLSGGEEILPSSEVGDFIPLPD